jgi:3-deoxy-D-manno-octulosonic acid (KDO) 8-phosphate synthase
MNSIGEKAVSWFDKGNNHQKDSTRANGLEKQIPYHQIVREQTKYNEGI